MPRAAACALMMLAVLAASPAVAAEEALVAAQALLSTWHEDPARIDRARALLETSVAANPTPEALTELSRAWFLTGDFRARSEAERVIAYERGMEAGRRAVAPRCAPSVCFAARRGGGGVSGGGGGGGRPPAGGPPPRRRATRRICFS